VETIFLDLLAAVPPATEVVQGAAQAAQGAAGSVPAGPTGAPPPQWLQFLGSFGPIILIFALLWFFIIGSKRRQDRQRNDMLGGMKKNDKVVLVGGEIGALVDIRDDRILVKVDESNNTKIWYTKDAISKVMKEKDEKVSK
jgi:preprotein translocase subunit YajC